MNAAMIFRQISQTRNVPLACAIAIGLTILFAIFWHYKPKFLVPTTPVSDPTNPDLAAAPIDLTTVGATVTLPPDHEILKGGSPAEISPDLNRQWTTEEIGNEFSLLRARIETLEQTK